MLASIVRETNARIAAEVPAIVPREPIGNPKRFPFERP